MIRRVSIRKKLIATILAFSAGSSLILGFLAYRMAKTTVERALFAGFETMREAKREEITTFVELLRNHARLISDNEWFVGVTRELVVNFENLQSKSLSGEQVRELEERFESLIMPDLARKSGATLNMATIFPRTSVARLLQYRYTPGNGGGISPDSAETDYERLILRIDAKVKEAVDAHEFEDLLIVHPTTGEIVYSISKGIDLGVNLFDSYLSGSKLAAAVREASGSPDGTDVRLVDFEKSPASNLNSRAFFVVPIHDESKLVAIAAFVMPGDKLDTIVNGSPGKPIEALGRTGEIFVVGDDALMRTESRFFWQDRDRFLADLKRAGIDDMILNEVRRLDTSVLNVPRQAAAVADFFRNGPYTRTVTGYLGVPVIASTSTLSIPDVRWGIVALIQEKEALEPLRSLGSRILGLAAGIALISALLGTWYGSALVSPVERLTLAARSLASGFRSVRVQIRSQDEFETLGDSFNEMAAVIDKERRNYKRLSQENAQLLEMLMPPRFVAGLWGGPGVRTGSGFYKEVAVSYSKLLNLSEIYRKFEPDEAVAMSESLTRKFKETAARNGVETLASGGGCYFAICGLSETVSNSSERMLRFVSELQRIVLEFDMANATGISIRSAIHRDMLSSGTIGHQEFYREMWRKTLDLADFATDSQPDERTRIIVSNVLFEKIAGLPGLGFVELDDPQSGSQAYSVKFV